MTEKEKFEKELMKAWRSYARSDLKLTTAITRMNQQSKTINALEQKLGQNMSDIPMIVKTRVTVHCAGDVFKQSKKP